MLLRAMPARFAAARRCPARANAFDTREVAGGTEFRMTALRLLFLMERLRQSIATSGPDPKHPAA